MAFSPKDIPFHCSEFLQKRKEYIECQSKKDIENFKRDLEKNIRTAQIKRIHEDRDEVSPSLWIRQDCKICPITEELTEEAERVGKKYGYRLTGPINALFDNYYFMCYTSESEQI